MKTVKINLNILITVLHKTMSVINTTQKEKILNKFGYKIEFVERDEQFHLIDTQDNSEQAFHLSDPDCEKLINEAYSSVSDQIDEDELNRVYDEVVNETKKPFNKNRHKPRKFSDHI